MMNGELVAVLVHYRTPERVAPAVDSLRQQARDADRSIQAIVVDNSGDAPEGDGWTVLPAVCGCHEELEVGCGCGSPT